MVRVKREGEMIKFPTHHTIKKQSNLLLLLYHNSDKQLYHTDTKNEIIWLLFTHFTYRFFFTHLFLALHSLSPDSKITNIQIFLSYSLLLVTDWQSSYCYRCFLHCRKLTMTAHIFINVIFLWFGETQDIYGPEPNFVGTETKLFNRHKILAVPGTLGWMESILAAHLHAYFHNRNFDAQVIQFYANLINYY
jgi:hypothetical protein